MSEDHQLLCKHHYSVATIYITVCIKQKLHHMLEKKKHFQTGKGKTPFWIREFLLCLLGHLVILCRPKNLCLATCYCSRILNKYKTVQAK